MTSEISKWQKTLKIINYDVRDFQNGKNIKDNKI